MGLIISINMQNGGVGKTVSAECISEALAMADYKVLGLDLDPQESYSMFSGAEECPISINDLMIDPDITKKKVQRAIVDTSTPGLQLIRCSVEHKETSKIIDNDNTRDQYMILRKIIELVEDDYDFIIIDNRPISDIVSMNSLAACDYVLVPYEPDSFSYKGLSDLLDEVEEIKNTKNPQLEILGIFLTRCEKRTVHYKNYREDLNDDLPGYLLDTAISNELFIKECATALVSPFIDNRGDALRDYIALIYELGFIEYEKYVELVLRFGKIKSVALEKIAQDDTYADEEIEILAEDIDKNGLITPLLVTQYKIGHYRIIDGGKRYSALLLNKEREEQEYEILVKKNKRKRNKENISYSKIVKSGKARVIEIENITRRADRG